VRKNHELAWLRSTKREDRRLVTEKALQQLALAVTAGRLTGKEKIALRVGRVLNRFKMARHFKPCPRVCPVPYAVEARRSGGPADRGGCPQRRPHGGPPDAD